MKESIRFLLHSYIIRGKVNYLELMGDKQFEQYVKSIENQDLTSFTIHEQFAFWLNAYNILTLKSIIDILKRNPGWKGNTSFWSKLKFFVLKKHVVAGRRLSLYSLENKILRGEFHDPRIHFAINCGSISCPVLPTTLFSPQSLDEYLNELTQAFVNSDNVQIQGDTLYLSPIFKWYRRDFVPSVVEFINEYREEKISKIKKIRYLPYDWNLNST